MAVREGGNFQRSVRDEFRAMLGTYKSLRQNSKALLDAILRSVWHSEAGLRVARLGVRPAGPVQAFDSFGARGKPFNAKT